MPICLSRYPSPLAPMYFFLGTHCGGRRCALPPAPPHPQGFPCYLLSLFSRERLRRVLRKKASVILDLHTFTPADLDLHTLTSADLHLHTFTSADLDLHTLTSGRSRYSHLHTCRSRSSHSHICRSTSSHLHIC